MRIKIFHLQIIVLSVLVSCKANHVSDDKIVVIDSFPSEQHINGTPIDIGNITQTLDLFGNNLLVYCSRGTPLFTVYDKTNYKSIRSFGTKGKGPNEILSFSSFSQIEFVNGNPCLWFFDRNKRKLFLLDLEQSKESGALTYANSILHTHQTISEDNIFVLNDTIVLGTSNNGNGQLFKYNNKTNQLEWEPYTPIIEPDDPELFGNLYKTYSGIKPDKSKIVSAFLFFNRVDIFSTDLKDKMSVLFTPEGETPVPPDAEWTWVEKNTQYFLDVYCTKDYIFILRCDCLESKLYDGDFKPVIDIINWNGDPLIKLYLDIPIDRIAVDVESGFVYGGNFITPGLGLVVYNFNNMQLTST